MKKEQVLHEIEDCLIRYDFRGLELNIDKLIDVSSEIDACVVLSQLLLKKYTTYSADATAKLMETIIRKKPNLALLEFPSNYFFRLSIICGSMDLYECYIEEAIEPYLKGKDEDEISNCYFELYEIANEIDDTLFAKEVPCVKGMDFNGAFAPYEGNSDVVLINREDYEIMNNVVEKYNAIIGRRNIISDLNKKM